MSPPEMPGRIRRLVQVERGRSTCRHTDDEPHTKHRW